MTYILFPHSIKIGGGKSRDRDRRQFMIKKKKDVKRADSYARSIVQLNRRQSNIVDENRHDGIHMLVDDANF